MFQNDGKTRKLILELLPQGFKTLISFILIAKIFAKNLKFDRNYIKIVHQYTSEIRSFITLFQLGTGFIFS